MMEFLGYLFLFALLGGIGFFFYWMWKKGVSTAGMEEATIPAPNIFDQGEYSAKLCEGEELVRAYNCAKLKSVTFGKIRADGILVVTNKRVIFQTIGVTDKKGRVNNDDYIHNEVPIADVSSVSVSTGLANEKALNILSPLFALLPGGKYKRLFFLDIYAKGVSGDEGAINVAPTDAKGATVAMPNYDMIPTSIVIEMANEVGAMINDIQKLGDLAVEKWKQ